MHLMRGRGTNPNENFVAFFDPGFHRIVCFLKFFLKIP